MPNIAEYEQPGLGLTPSETGIEAVAGAARRGGQFFNQAAESVTSEGARIGRGIGEVGQGVADVGKVAVDFMDHQQINAGAKHGADLLSGLTDNWNNTAKNADPNDPATAAKWRDEQLEPALQQFQDGFSTEKSKDWAERFTTQMRDHLFQKTTADMSTLAGVAVQTNVHDITNRYSNTAQADPSSVPFLLDAVDHQIGGIVDSSPNLKGADAARVKMEVAQKTKEAIVKSGVFGAINAAKDPEAAAAMWAKKYPDYINGQEAEQFAKAAKVQARTLEASEKQKIYYDRLLANQNVDLQRNKIWSDNVTIDPGTNRPVIKPDFFQQAAKLPMQNPNAPEAINTARTLLDWGEMQQRGEHARVDNQNVVDGLQSGIMAPDNQTKDIDILKAEIKHDITPQTGSLLRQMLRDFNEAPIKDPEFRTAMNGAKQLIEVGGKELNAGKFDAFQQKFMKQYQQLTRENKVPPNALDLSDPKSLIRQMMPPNPLSEIIMNNGGVSPSGAGKPPAGIAPPIGAQEDEEARQRAQGNAGPAPVIRDKAGYDGLAPGTVFTDSAGTKWKKPGDFNNRFDNVHDWQFQPVGPQQGTQAPGGKGPGMIGSMLSVFAGPVAAANLSKAGFPQPQLALDMAQKLKDAGASAAEIYKITTEFLKSSPFGGVRVTADGSPRFEIPDNDMKIKQEGKSDRADSAISHPLFFSAYPHMAGAAVDFNANLPLGTNGNYNPETGKINVNKMRSPTNYSAGVEGRAQTKEQILAHEFNHAAQQAEGDLDVVNPVGVPKSYGSWQDYVGEYYHNLNEAEAAASANRQTLTPDQRRAPANVPMYGEEGGKFNFSKNTWGWKPWMGAPPEKPGMISKLTNMSFVRKLLQSYRDELARETHGRSAQQ